MTNTDQSGQGAQGYSGQFGIPDGNSEANVIDYFIRVALGRVRTIVPAVVVAVSGGTQSAGPPTVDVQPLVKQMDGAGNVYDHGILLDLPVMRWQSANGSVVVDPVVNDIGLILVCDRDISAVVSSGGQASQPGSFRRHSLPDGIYLGGILGAAPPQYVAMTATGVTISDRNSNKLEMKAGSIALTTASFTVNGSVIAGFGGTFNSLKTHTHPGNNLPPNPNT